MRSSLILSRPAILRAVDPWKIEINRKLLEVGLGRSMRQEVIRSIERIIGGSNRFIKCEMDMLLDWAGVTKLGMFVTTQLAGFGAGGARPKVLTYLTNQVDPATQTTYNFTADIGAESADRRIIVCVYADNSTRTISSGSVNSVATTTVVSVQGGTGTAGILIAHVPTGTTGVTISVTWSGTQPRTGIGYYAAYGLTSDTAYATDAEAASNSSNHISLTTPTGGFAVSCGGNNASAPTTSGSSVGTNSYEAVIEGITYHYSNRFSASVDMTIVHTATGGRGLVGASW